MAPAWWGMLNLNASADQGRGVTYSTLWSEGLHRRMFLAGLAHVAGRRTWLQHDCLAT